MILSKAIVAVLVYIGPGLTTLAQQKAASTTGRQLTGMVIDFKTRMPLSNAILFAKLPKDRLRINKSNEAGQFSIDLPDETIAIQVEKKGYSPGTLSLQSMDGKWKSQSIPLLLPVIALDSIGTNRTYLQTAQTAYVLPDNATESNAGKKLAQQHGHFMVKDILQNLPLRAKICFFYTKTEQKVCVNTDANGELTLAFTAADIIAVEATATGYQPYKGNLIIDSLDGRQAVHVLPLQRELTILAVKADGATACRLAGATKTYKLTEVPGHAGWFSTYETSPQSGELIITHQSGTHRQPVKLGVGLNLFTFSPLLKTTLPGPENRLTNPVAKDRFTLNLDSLPAIYFEQSSYTLRQDSQEILKQVAEYMQSHKQYRLKVTGHTDNVGDEHLNMSLSEFRASAAIAFLISLGVTENQCVKVGAGSQQPIADNDIEAHRAKNRRVSLQLITGQ